MPDSKAIQKLEERISQVEPGTLRYETLQAAKRFKNSWIELGRMLWTVYKEKKFREWDYLTFETYCAKEIGIRAGTAKKLLHSYYFLEKEEPTVLKQLSEESPGAVPNVESVNLLRLLNKRQESLPTHGYQKIRSYVLEKAQELPEIRREIRLMQDNSEPDSQDIREKRRVQTIQRMIGSLKGISQELKAARLIPATLLNEIKTLIQKLEDLL